MFCTGYSCNCGLLTSDVLCNSCREFCRCARCYRYLLAHLHATDSNICNASQHRDESNVGVYCLHRVIGDRRWRGTADEIDVSTFILSHCDDITITFEAVRNENEAIKYYLEMEVEFYSTGQEGDVQHTTSRFYIPPMTSNVDNLNLSDIVKQFMEKIDGFSGQNSSWIVSQINYVRLCWGHYRPLMASTFIHTPKFIASKKVIVNIQCYNDDNCFQFQYSVLAGINEYH